jgi:LysR family transcriptional regulator for metE and metH
VPEKNREYELFFQPSAVYPERIVQVGFTGAILELVAAGIGSTIVTRWIMDADETRGNVVTRPLTSKGLKIHWFAVFSRKPGIDAQADTLCEVIENQGRQFSPEL